MQIHLRISKIGFDVENVTDTMLVIALYDILKKVVRLLSLVFMQTTICIMHLLRVFLRQMLRLL